MGTASTRGYTLTLTFAFGGFIVFLGSAQPIIDNIYGRGDQFVLWFAAASVLMAVGFFTVNGYIDRFGSHAVAGVVLRIVVGLSLVLLVWAILTDGVPPFWAWIVLIALPYSPRSE